MVLLFAFNWKEFVIMLRCIYDFLHLLAYAQNNNEIIDTLPLSELVVTGT